MTKSAVVALSPAQVQVLLEHLSIDVKDQLVLEKRYKLFIKKISETCVYLYSQDQLCNCDQMFCSNVSILCYRETDAAPNSSILFLHCMPHIYKIHNPKRVMGGIIGVFN